MIKNNLHTLHKIVTLEQTKSYAIDIGVLGCDLMYFKQTDYGPDPYVTNIQHSAMQNENYRTAIWTGKYAQMTLMCIPPCQDIGLEIHPDTDQFIRVEHGCGIAMMGKQECLCDLRQMISCGDVVFVPAGTWHNIVNTGTKALKLSTIYAPPHHPKCTIHQTKNDAK